MDKLPKEVLEKLKYYVYLYSDPRDNKIFYVGKGKNNRVFHHLNEQSEKEKVKRIQEISNAGLTPKIEILVHGIDDEYTAKKIEASIIDLVEKDNLTNIQSGYESSEFGRMNIEQILSLYSARQIKISTNHKVILIRINKSFRYSLTPIELYDITRSSWKIDPNKHKPDYAFSVYNSLVQEVYKISAWLPDNSTLNTLQKTMFGQRPDRYEFVGVIAEEEIRNKYRFRNVGFYFKQGNQNPVMYVNC